jgi:glutathione S-transferase
MRPMPHALTLYSFAPFDRALRVRWTAAELGLEVQERRLDYANEEHKQSAYRALNPFGHVPTVELDGVPMFESIAICQYLAERVPSVGLVPALHAPDRAAYLSWLLFGASDYDSHLFHVFHGSVLRPDAARRERALARATPLLDVVDAHLADRTYALGEQFSLVDIVLGHGIVLLSLSKAIDAFPNLVAYRSRLAERPAAQAARVFKGLKSAA